jgi:hypothetical protein
MPLAQAKINSTTRGLTQKSLALRTASEELEKIEEIDGKGGENWNGFWKLGENSKIGRLAPSVVLPPWNDPIPQGFRYVEFLRALLVLI